MLIALGAIVLAIIAMLPENSTNQLAHWIRMGLVAALPLSGLAIVLYPFVTRKSPSNDKGDVPPRTAATVLFGVLLGLLVTLTSVGAGAIGVTVLAALYPLLPAKRLVGTDIAHAVPLTLVGGLGHFGLGNVDVGLLLALLVALVMFAMFILKLASDRIGNRARSEQLMLDPEELRRLREQAEARKLAAAAQNEAPR